MNLPILAIFLLPYTALALPYSWFFFNIAVSRFSSPACDSRSTLTHTSKKSPQNLFKLLATPKDKYRDTYDSSPLQMYELGHGTWLKKCYGWDSKDKSFAYFWMAKTDEFGTQLFANQTFRDPRVGVGKGPWMRSVEWKTCELSFFEEKKCKDKYGGKDPLVSIENPNTWTGIHTCHSLSALPVSPRSVHLSCKLRGTSNDAEPHSTNDTTAVDSEYIKHVWQEEVQPEKAFDKKKANTRFGVESYVVNGLRYGKPVGQCRHGC